MRVGRKLELQNVNSIMLEKSWKYGEDNQIKKERGHAEERNEYTEG